MIKPISVVVDSNEIVFKDFRRTWTTSLAELESVRLRNVTSLVDEIGIWIRDPQREYFLTDAIPGAVELFELLRLDDVLGKDWYSRAESGEELIVDKKAIGGAITE
jgi:hypothetical protein